MVLKAVIGTVAGLAGLIGVLSAVPADMSQLRYIDRCVTQMMMPMPMGCGPYNIDLTKAGEQKSYEEAILLFFLNGSSRVASLFVSLEPTEDIDQRLVALPAEKIGGKLGLASVTSTSESQVETAGLLQWLIAGIILV
ncbi:hypothetical protein [Rhizobium leguminosarum]|uniref:hypothetical protein n=1 Tax=Rhizobium leguminosarum TaxID=384 RepID=UPI00102FE8A3|nr:hypothetical protein [Rhizobium leguminosarum]TBG52563.1 hypothetical protein ELG74_36310 [Rhizobium leguminosarum]